jgi:hypothetical protein
MCWSYRVCSRQGTWEGAVGMDSWCRSHVCGITCCAHGCDGVMHHGAQAWGSLVSTPAACATTIQHTRRPTPLHCLSPRCYGKLTVQKALFDVSCMPQPASCVSQVPSAAAGGGCLDAGHAAANPPGRCCVSVWLQEGEGRAQGRKGRDLVLDRGQQGGPAARCTHPMKH